MLTISAGLLAVTLWLMPLILPLILPLTLSFALMLTLPLTVPLNTTCLQVVSYCWVHHYSARRLLRGFSSMIPPPRPAILVTLS